MVVVLCGVFVVVVVGGFFETPEHSRTEIAVVTLNLFCFFFFFHSSALGRLVR